MKPFRNLRSQLLRYATTALTVSLLITLRVETPCTTPSAAADSSRISAAVRTGVPGDFPNHNRPGAAQQKRRIGNAGPEVW